MVVYILFFTLLSIKSYSCCLINNKSTIKNDNYSEDNILKPQLLTDIKKQLTIHKNTHLYPNLIDKFIIAQQSLVDGSTFTTALNEIKNGKKISCWMWYIFPNISGLGSSNINKKYSLKNRDEVMEYLENDQLRGNLIEITKAVIECKNKYPEKNIKDIFGGDDCKLKTSMTLFYFSSEYIRMNRPDIDYSFLIQKYDSTLQENVDINIFKLVLDIYFNGQYCDHTEKKVKNWFK